ncbi:30S ribosomal protein S5, partial [Candidatus Woesearchaeota archaeon CG_4_10_14_0_8_um_filter_47_5]
MSKEPKNAPKTPAKKTEPVEEDDGQIPENDTSEEVILKKIEEVIEEETDVTHISDDTRAKIEGWVPKTAIGKKVLSGEIKSVDAILEEGHSIREPEIVDILFPELTSELLLIGQAKGKFGGGKRRVFKQTQKKTPEGNKPHFATCAVVGNKAGYVGIGYGKARETVPAREKAIRRAKCNVFKIRRGSGSWEDASTGNHSIPYAVTGKCGSVILTLLPAPKGTGLIVEKECARILELAGIRDIRSATKGKTRTKLNLVRACEKALHNLMEVKIMPQHYDILGIYEGAPQGAPNQTEKQAE